MDRSNNDVKLTGSLLDGVILAFDVRLYVRLLLGLVTRCCEIFSQSPATTGPDGDLHVLAKRPRQDKPS